MKMLILTVLLHISDGDIHRIAKINKLKKTAEKAYKSGDYERAIASFRTLTDSLEVDEDAVWLNLANAYFETQDTAQAMEYYVQVAAASQGALRSQAFQQLGVMMDQRNRRQEALNNFKEALKADPMNEDARYNYELLKKMLGDEQNSSDSDDSPEPSEYAKKLKEQADKLVKMNLFPQALQLMQNGLQKDETVSAYNQFIQKLNDVVQSQQN
jgi:Ca-activated chloride channel family protein